MNFLVNYELKPNFGEDAPPVVNSNALAVFDGMGGAGGSKYTIDGMVRTGAYVASRISSKSFSRFTNARNIFDATYSLPDDQKALAYADYAHDLKDAIIEDLREYADQNSIVLTSKIKGSLFKLLPTTIAGVVYKENKDDIELLALWAGDSRVFILDPRDGLLQVTKDNLEVDHDAMENLIDDAKMNNNINLSSDFTINHKYLKISKPCILFCATDGCFGYLPSPMHFEELFYNSMIFKASDSIDILGEKLQRTLLRVASDDCSIAGKFFGIKTPQELLGLFTKRQAFLKEKIMSQMQVDFFGNINKFEQEQLDYEIQQKVCIDEIKEVFANKVMASYTNNNDSDPLLSLECYKEFKEGTSNVNSTSNVKISLDKLDGKQKDVKINLENLFRKEYVEYAIESNNVQARTQKLIVKYRTIQNDLLSKKEGIMEDSKYYLDLYDNIDFNQIIRAQLLKISKGEFIDPMFESEINGVKKDITNFFTFILSNLQDGRGIQDIIRLQEQLDKVRDDIVASELDVVTKKFDDFINNPKKASFASKELIAARENLQNVINELENKEKSMNSINIKEKALLLFDSNKDDIVAFLFDRNEISEETIIKYNTCADAINKVRQKIYSLQEHIDATELWKVYKPTYERYMKED